MSEQAIAALDRRTEAAASFQPSKIRLLLVAETPPTEWDRYFYFDVVHSNDWLFREVTSALFNVQPERSKRLVLNRLKDAEVFLIDLKPDPSDEAPFEDYVDSLVERCQRLRPEHIILIKVNVYDLAFARLNEAGLPVCDERIPFPSTGQQGNFRRKFASALEAIGWQN